MVHIYNCVKILIVEDDEYINGLISGIMQKKGYSTRSAYSGSEAQMYLSMYDYHLIMLDLMVPAVSGEQLIEYIRKIKTMPIIVISAKDTPETRVEVLRLGADDFIAKPFDVEEVSARVEAQLRRYMIFSNSSSTSKILNYKNIRMDIEAIRTFINDKEIILTAREFSILELLIRYPNKVFTKANIFEHVWNDKFVNDDNTVNVHISNLRAKISSVDPDNEYIKTVWGIGFKLHE